MSIALELDFSQVNQFMETFSALKMRSSKRLLMDSLGALIVGQMQERFQTTKTDPDGKAWEGWSPKTARMRNKSHSLLMWQKQLFHSLDYENNIDDLQAGSNMEYAGWINDGTSRMVPRAFVGLSDDNLNDLEKAITEWVESELLHGY